jgi:uncharacterized protein DUF4232/ricin-type beta-trefoil lectin protein
MFRSVLASSGWRRAGPHRPGEQHHHGGRGSTARSAAALAAAACLAVLAAGCASNGPAPAAGAARSPGTSATAAPAGPPSTPAATAPATTAPAGQAPAPRCHTSQLSVAFTGLNAAMGGQRGMTLILTNHSGAACSVYGYPGLAFYTGRGFPMATHLSWMTAPHTQVRLRPGGNAQAMLTWRVNPYPLPTTFDPDLVHITPPDEYARLQAVWQGGPVRGGDIVAWPLRAAPAGPFPAGTGTIASPLNGMCVALAADGTTVVAWTCSPGASSQQWTGYNDGTLRIGGKCLAVTGPGAGAKAEVAACTGAATQKWVIGQTSSNDFGALYNTGTRTVLTDPGNSTTNGTQLVTGPDRGDQSYPWRVSFYHYMKG